MIISFKTKKIKGSPSGYFVTKESLSSKKLNGFKNIGDSKYVIENEILLLDILDKMWHHNFKEFWYKCYLTRYFLAYLDLKNSFISLMFNSKCTHISNFESYYKKEYRNASKQAHNIDFAKITKDNFFVFVRE